MRRVLPFLAFLICAGCSAPEATQTGAKDTVLLGDSAPSLGDAGIGTLDKFVVGTWRNGTGMDKEQAKQMGMSSIADFQEGTETYTFKADGTLDVTTRFKQDVLSGKWRVEGDTVVLEFATYGGNPVGSSPGGFAAEAVKLTVWRVAPDKKHLYCNSQVVQDAAPGSAQIASGAFLERLGAASK